MEYKTAADGAKNLKRELQAEFPGVNFTVRSKSFSGGNDITVNYDFGPNPADVKAIANKYEEGSFDGSIDLYTYDEDRSFTSKYGGAKYVMVQRHLPNDIYKPFIKQYCEIMNGCVYNETDPEQSKETYPDGSFAGCVTESVYRIVHEVDFRNVKEFKLIWDDKINGFNII